MKVTEKGVAYYVLLDSDLKELNIHNERGKEYLSLMSGIKGVPIWFCVTEIIEKNEYRVSIRSKKIDISQVAAKYRGGGHLNASGATIYSLDEMSELIKELEALI
jgi:phosphoesterase RecJ-like protein